MSEIRNESQINIISFVKEFAGFRTHRFVAIEKFSQSKSEVFPEFSNCRPALHREDEGKRMLQSVSERFVRWQNGAVRNGEIVADGCSKAVPLLITHLDMEVGGPHS